MIANMHFDMRARDNSPRLALVAVHHCLARWHSPYRVLNCSISTRTDIGPISSAVAINRRY